MRLTRVEGLERLRPTAYAEVRLVEKDAVDVHSHVTARSGHVNHLRHVDLAIVVAADEMPNGQKKVVVVLAEILDATVRGAVEKETSLGVLILLVQPLDHHPSGIAGIPIQAELTGGGLPNGQRRTHAFWLMGRS
jgi:hypothetical protein